MDNSLVRMMQYIDRATSNSEPYVARVLATELVAKLRANDPELLQEFLDAHAEDLIWRMITDRDRSMRAHTKATSSTAAFERATSRGQEAVQMWLDETRFTCAENIRKSLGDMTHEDLTTVAASYTARARDNQMTAALLSALGKKLRNGETVRDRFTEEQIVQMWESVSR